VADAVVVGMKMMTAIKALHVVVKETRAVATIEVGLEMKRVTRKQQGKVGSIGAEEETAAAMRTIIKDLLVGAAARAVGKAGDGMEMKRNIHGQQDEVGEIVIESLEFQKGYIKQSLNVPLLI
jgi:DNA-binding protein